MGTAVPQKGDIITIDMFEESIAEINRLLMHNDRLLPNTLYGSLEAIDKFLSLSTRCLHQNTQLAHRCLQMTHFLEDIHALAALALTPALTLMIYWLFSHSAIDNTRVPLVAWLGLNPYWQFCFIPVPLIFYYVYIMWFAKETLSQEPFTPPLDPLDINILIDELYPPLKDWSKLYNESYSRRSFVITIWTLTGLMTLHIMGIDRNTPRRLIGLVLVAAVNFGVGYTLTTFPSYSNSLRSFYTPGERVVRIMSFSPIYHALLTFIAMLFTPFFTNRLDYNHLRKLCIKSIHEVDKSFDNVRDLQKGIRDVRQPLVVSKHFQNLAEGLVSQKIDINAGRGIAKGVPKITSSFLKWMGGKALELLIPSSQ